MKRREFFASAGVLLAGGYAAGSASAGDAESVKNFIAAYYDVFYRGRDPEKYRALLTDDYRLLENGEIFDAAGDIASMPKPGSRYERTDRFDVRQVKVEGEIAWTVYFLESDITDENGGPVRKRWLESAILRRASGGWKIAILHSTKIAKAG